MRTILRRIDSMNMNIEFKAGHNAQENHELIDASKPTDIWFHIYNYQSCHVVASIPTDLVISKNDMRKIVKQGALACKQFSKFKSTKNVEIEYTEIRNVTKDSVPGRVSVTNLKQIKI